MEGLKTFGKTDIGRVRNENQDYFGIFEDKGVFVVCDGMGGGACGDFASKTAVDIIEEILNKEFKKINIFYSFAGNRQQITDIFFNEQSKLILAINIANKVLYNLQNKILSLSGMGTTLTALMFDEIYNIVHIFNVGDSRIYRYRKGAIEQLTKDHSKVEELISQGKLTKEQLLTSELKSMVVRVLGPKSNIIVDYKNNLVYPGDVYILCTDGITDLVNLSSMKDIIEKNFDNPNKICDDLIDLANYSGGLDNSTVLVIKIENEYRKQVPPQQSFQFIDRLFECTIDERKIPKLSSTILRITKKFNKKLPEKAKEKSIFRSPFILGMFFFFILVMIVNVVYYYKKRWEETNKTMIEKALVSEIFLDIRIPGEKSIKEYKEEQNQTQKLFIIDFLKSNFNNLVSAKGVYVSIYNERGEEIYNIIYSSAVKIKLDEGKYRIDIDKGKYHLIPMELSPESDTFEVVKSKEAKFVRFIIIPKF